MNFAEIVVLIKKGLIVFAGVSTITFGAFSLLIPVIPGILIIIAGVAILKTIKSEQKVLSS